MVIGGRVADVDLALGHDDVRALAVQKAAERGPRDSRRLALAKEGQLAEGSPAWEDMSAGDRAKRKRAAGGVGWGGVGLGGLGWRARAGGRATLWIGRMCCAGRAAAPAMCWPAV